MGARGAPDDTAVDVRQHQAFTFLFPGAMLHRYRVSGLSVRKANEVDFYLFLRSRVIGGLVLLILCFP